NPPDLTEYTYNRIRFIEKVDERGEIKWLFISPQFYLAFASSLREHVEEPWRRAIRSRSFPRYCGEKTQRT
ncbi:MAG: hypothetical protein QW405_03875, partial [Fervidicoccaceae archaeon]